MSKKLRDTPLYLAPKIIGYRDENYNPVIEDEKTGCLLDPNCIDDKITIYERQVKAWFLDRAARLTTGKNNGFIVLMIATAYIEGVQQYINGAHSNGQSRRIFLDGLRRIFSLDEISDGRISEFYRHVRCGLFHNGMSGEVVVINFKSPMPIDFSHTEIIKINPRLVLSTIRKDFSIYINRLRNENNIIERENFNQMFNVI